MRNIYGAQQIRLTRVGSYRIQNSTRRQDTNEVAFFREAHFKPEKRFILVVKNGLGASEVYRVDVYPF